MLSVTSGGSVVIPGLSPDGNDPAGLIIDGDINVANGTLRTALGYVTGFAIRVDGSNMGIRVFNHSGVSVGQWTIFGLQTANGAYISSADAVYAAKAFTGQDSLGIWGKTPPAAQAVLATGASHTVDDVITLLQSYGLCKQA